MKSATTAIVMALALVTAPGLGSAESVKDRFVVVQPEGQWLASLFIGQSVRNDAGESIGNIKDLLVDKSGRIASVVVGVGGFLGIGEKNVALPYDALSLTADDKGKRVVTISVSKEQLKAAPEFKATEKSFYTRAKEKAGELGGKALDTARELKDKMTK